MNNDTICATATANGVGALGILRISGADAVVIANKIFKGTDLEKVASHTVHYGFVQNKNEIVDEVMLSVFRAPKTFTAEDLVEITCHGSPYIQEQIISLLLQNGCRLATAGEFTQRAFLNGRIDLAQAEAVADLIAAENKASHEIALNHMRGGISSELQILREQLINFTALIELELDFTDEDVEFANREELRSLVKSLKCKVHGLVDSFEYGNALKNGVPVAIIGKPNAGKSTLLNALLKEERAIVSDIAGTTRDVIEETITLDGITFRFIDTAGIRNTQDVIEAMGVERAKEKVQQAQVVIHLYENNPDLLDELKDHFQGKMVFNLQSKSDIHTATDFASLQQKYPEYEHFGISVKTENNLSLLTEKLVAHFKKQAPDNAIIITNLRHKEALQNALIALAEVENGLNNQLSGDLLSIHLREALTHIGSITGTIDFDKDILGTIFGKFCIGK